MNKRFQEYTEERERLLQHIHSALMVDDRVAGAWLAGSLGRGTLDDLSDLDIWVAVTDAALPDVVNAPEAFVHAIVTTILEVSAPSIAPPGGAFLLTWVAGSQGPQQVDWYFAPAVSACRHPDTRLLFAHLDIPVCQPPTPLAGVELDRAERASRGASRLSRPAWRSAGTIGAWRAV